MVRSIKDRILNNITITESGCWNWNLAKRNGYGRLQLGNYKKSAHRVSYELFVADIPEGFEIDHRCKNKSCVNPEHLEVVTRSVNVQRSKPTQCPRGHLYDEQNTYYNPRGFRQCKTCDYERKKRL